MSDDTKDEEPRQPTYQEMVSLLNPNWQVCTVCGHFHPIRSSC